jgi:hypothetical protein
VIKAADLAEGEAFLEERRVLGLIVISSGLEARLASNDGAFVSFIPARGTNAGRVVGKYAAAAAVALKTEQRYRDEFAAVGAGAPPLRAGAEHILSVSYDGPPLLQDAFALTPGYGTPAVFVLLIALYAALTLAGPDRRRIVMRGPNALILDYFGGFLAVFSVCALLLSGYFLSGFFIYGALPDRNAVGAFVALALFSIALGGLAAALGLRRVSVWLFLPWLLVNAALGGALWGVAFSHPLVAPLLPVRHALYACAGQTEHIFFLSVFALTLTALTIPILRRIPVRNRR